MKVSTTKGNTNSPTALACQIRQVDGADTLLFLVTCERYLEVPAVNGFIEYSEEVCLQVLCALARVGLLFQRRRTGASATATDKPSLLRFVFPIVLISICGITFKKIAGRFAFARCPAISNGL